MASTANRARKVSLPAKTQAGQSAGITPTPAVPSQLTVDDIRKSVEHLRSISPPPRQFFRYSLPENATVAPVASQREPVARLSVPVITQSREAIEKHRCASHLRSALMRVERDTTVERCLDVLRGQDFDTIAVRGVSGLLIGPILAHLLGKELLVIRKPKREEGSVSFLDYEGHYGAQRYIIVDDLVCSFSTAVRIFRGVTECAPQAKLVGLLTYDTFNFHGEESKFIKLIQGYAADPGFHPVR